jgi:hypothetical protein
MGPDRAVDGEAVMDEDEHARSVDPVIEELNRIALEPGINPWLDPWEEV